MLSSLNLMTCRAGLLGGAVSLGLGCSGGDSEPNVVGAGAFRTHVVFDHPGLTAREKEDIVRTLSEFEQNPRSYNPSLFRHFNGWRIVTSEQLAARNADAVGLYDPNKREVLLLSGLFARGHEFCHYVDDVHRIEHGKRVSETLPWGALSCFLNRHPSQDCVDSPAHFDRGSDEEFANVCADLVQNPPGALLKFSGNSHTLKQASFGADAVGYPRQGSEAVRKTLRTPVRASLEPFGALEISEESFRQRVPGGPWVFNSLGEGAFAFLLSPRLLAFSPPPAETAAVWNLRQIELPQGFDAKKGYRLAYQAGKLFLQQGDQLKGRNVSGGAPLSPWETLYQSDQAFKEPRILTVVGGQPTFLLKDRYWTLKGVGAARSQSYSSAVRDDIREAAEGNAIQADGRTYLWLRDIRADGRSPISRLYRIDLKVGFFDFVREWELPLTEDASQPLFYKGNWHIIQRPTNNYLTDRQKLSRLFPNHGHPVFLRIEKGGTRLTPIEPRYPGDAVDAFYDDMQFSSLFHATGTRFIGVDTSRGLPFLTAFELK